MFLLLLLCIPSLSALNCTNSFNFEASSCVFNSDNNDGSCRSFNFVNCSRQECGSWFFNGKVAFCTSYVTRYNTDWKSCTQACCGGSNYPANWQSVQSCQVAIYQNSSTQNTILLIILCVAGGVVLIAVGIFCFCRHYRNVEISMMRPEDSGQIVINHIYRNQNYIENSSKIKSSSQKFVGVGWVEQAEELQKFKECCSVCLELGVSLQLQCGHSYHRKCIIECVSRKAECILCRTVNINNAKVYCEACMGYYCQTTLIDHLGQLANGEVKCPRCREQNLETGK